MMREKERIVSVRSFGSCSVQSTLKGQRGIAIIDRVRRDEGLEVKKVTCWASPGCHQRCGLLVTVKDGRIVGIKGNPEYSSPGHGCADRMPHFAKWLYHSEQLLHPLKRMGERGENKWERISWDQALDFLYMEWRN